MPNLSQSHILKQIAIYLTQRNRDPVLIKQLSKKGFCVGFTSLNLYAKWLDTQARRTDHTNAFIPRDDFTWLTHALTTISTWDTKSTLTKNQEDCFEHVLAKINAYQHLSDLLSISQTDFHLFFEDTLDRTCKLEYSLVARFTIKELINCLPDLLQDNKLIFIRSHNHAMGIFKNNNVFSFINPNANEGMTSAVIDLPAFILNTISNSLKADEHLKNMLPQLLPLAILLFAESDFDMNQASPIVIQIMSIQDANLSLNYENNYPSIDYFLDKISTHKIAYNKPNGGYAGNCTELHLAAEIGSAELINYFLKQKIAEDKNYIDQPEKDGATALLVAVQYSHINVIQALLKAGANPNTETTKDGITPLQLAIINGKIEVIKALVQAGANVNHLNAKDGFSPLAIAASCNDLQSTIADRLIIIDYLLNEKADINLSSSCGMTALAHAIDSDNFAMISPLLNRGARCTGIEIMLAIKKNHERLAKEFIRYGANIHRALMYAAQMQDQATMDTLVKLGAKPTQAFILSIETGSTQGMNTLTRYDDVKLLFQDCGINSLLLYAAQNNQPNAFMQLLLPQQTPQQGWRTWLLIAREKGIDIVKFGFDIMVNVHIKNLLNEQKNNEDSFTWRLFNGHAHEKKLIAVNSLAESLNDISSAVKKDNLKTHENILTTSLKQPYEMYNTICDIQQIKNEYVVKMSL